MSVTYNEHFIYKVREKILQLGNVVGGYRNKPKTQFKASDTYFAILARVKNDPNIIELIKMGMVDGNNWRFRLRPRKRKNWFIKIADLTLEFEDELYTHKNRYGKEEEATRKKKDENGHYICNKIIIAVSGRQYITTSKRIAETLAESFGINVHIYLKTEKYYLSSE